MDMMSRKYQKPKSAEVEPDIPVTDNTIKTKLEVMSSIGFTVNGKETENKTIAKRNEDKTSENMDILLETQENFETEESVENTDIPAQQQENATKGNIAAETKNVETTSEYMERKEAADVTDINEESVKPETKKLKSIVKNEAQEKMDSQSAENIEVPTAIQQQGDSTKENVAAEIKKVEITSKSIKRKEAADAKHKNEESVKPKTKKLKSYLKSETREKLNPELAKNTDVPSQQQRDVSKKNVAAETENTEKTLKSMKRKAATDVKDKNEESVKPKAKKPKTLLEIPKRSTTSGKVFVMGQNGFGQLGLGEDIFEKERPSLLDLPYSIVDIVAGGIHSVCLTESGEVITFGCNDEGALGRITSEEDSEYIPHRVDIPERIIQVSAGDSHSAALSESGQVYIWGNFRNKEGAMGLIPGGDKQFIPIKILIGKTIVKIASGCDHLVCLSQDGVVYTCGSGDVGQLGRVPEHRSDGGRFGKSLLLMPDTVPVSKASRSCFVNNIWAGSYSTFLNVQESSIFACGLNNWDQLGLRNENNIWKPKQMESFNNFSWFHISGGLHHTLCLDKYGSVYSLGRSEYGRLGLGENCGQKSKPNFIPAFLWKKCTAISCGNCASFAVTENGSVYSWGMGENYQLGHNDDCDQHSPRLVEGNFFNSWEALKISGGGLHTLILARPKKSLQRDQ